MAIAVSRDEAEQVAETAAAVVASGAISANGHGNVSIRIPNSSEMLFSTAPTLRGLTADMVARIRRLPLHERRIDCWIEALAMFGLADGVPVASMGRVDRPRLCGTFAPRSIRADAPRCSRTMASSSSIARRHRRS